MDFQIARKKLALIVGGAAVVVVVAGCGKSVVVDPTTTTEGLPPVLTPRSPEADSMTPTMGTSATGTAAPKT